MKAIITLLTLAALLCGCSKPDPYAKLDESLARFQAALKGRISLDEYTHFAADIRYERGRVAVPLPKDPDQSKLIQTGWRIIDDTSRQDGPLRPDNIKLTYDYVKDLREWLDALRHGQVNLY